MKLKILLFLTIILFSISFCNAEQCYYHYDSDNQLLTFKVPEIPANGEVTYYVNEDVNSANYSNPNEVYDFYCDASTYNPNDWTIVGATVSVVNDRVQLAVTDSADTYDDGYMYYNRDINSLSTVKMYGQLRNGGQFALGNYLMGGTDVASNSRFQSGVATYFYTYNDAPDAYNIIADDNDHYHEITMTPSYSIYTLDSEKKTREKTSTMTDEKLFYRNFRTGTQSFKWMGLQKYNENIVISKSLENGKLKVTIKNNNNYNVANYQIDCKITELNPTINSFNIPNQYIETDEGLQIQKDKEVINLGDSVQFSVISNYDIDSYTWDFGDGTTESTTTNIIAHTYAKSGDYTVVCKAILTNGDVKYNKIDFIVGTKISNAEIKFLDELTGGTPSNLSINGVLFTNNNYLVNISNNTNYNVTYPEYSTITFTSSDGLIRQVETTNLSSYEILLPPANTYVVQYNIISYSDDKIEVKTTDLKTINVGNKDVVAHLIKGKTYNIFVNGNFYKQIIAKDPDTIYINQNANQEIGSIFDNKLSERIEYNIQPNGQYGQYLVVLSNKDKAIGKVIVVTEKNTDTYITYNEINSTFALTRGYNELDASIYRCEENSEILYDIFVNQNYQNYDVTNYTKFQILTKKIYFESYEPPYFTFTFYLVLCFLISAILFVILSASSGNLHLSLLVSSVIFAVVQDIFHIGAIGKISSGLFLSIAILAWVWTVFKRGAENG
ncbi:hypothetical protein M2325_000705 [Methanococcus voltae PS]|uniref:PKD domain-containing protein n=1 Tax=Methanococcus voltae PS TaxID=523842 RepID=A0ABT2EVY6_METVO|nr:PKD domain-containing protein [Methanococcus voltae]MCS3922020.1 hypothetical protein [Methanococcus voltae PS]